MNFFTEMRRRNVFRVAGTYVVAGWFLVQTAFTLESVMQLPEWFDAMAMALMVLGFPISIILAWIFELTPDGFKRTEAIHPDDRRPAKKARIVDYGILTCLILVGGFLAAERFIPRAPSSGITASLSGNHSVAVLPFTNRSADTANAFFADGIHDQLLTQLSKVAGMEVISRTSVMGYRNTDKRIPMIAEELGVAVILEGAVQRAGDRVKITVQLIDGGTDTHLWAQDYDRALTTENIFDIQAEITGVIASALETVLSGDEQSRLTAQPTQNIEAFEAYIQAKVLSRPGGVTAEELRRAIQNYDKAIALDANFADAWANKAYVQMGLYWFKNADESYRNPAARDAAKITLDRAIALAPNSLDTLRAEAFYHYWGHRNFRKADAVFDKALQVAPNDAEALAGKAFLTRRLGDFKTASSGLEKAHRLDPRSYYLIPELALTYALIGEFDKADAMMERAKSLQPESLQGAAFEAAIFQFKGENSKAAKVLEDISEQAARQGWEPILRKQRLDYAIASRDMTKVDALLDSWTDGLAKSPAYFTTMKIKGLLASGDSEGADAEIAVLRGLTKTSGATANWSIQNQLSPVLVPALLGDVATVNRFVAEYEAKAPDDAMAALTHLSDIADAYARVGEVDRAFDYLDKVITLTGPQFFLLIRNDPAMDDLREHPRYLKLLADFKAWENKSG